MNSLTREAYKPSEFGLIPAEWYVSSFEEVTLEHKQGYYTKEAYTDSGARLLRITDLKNPEIQYENSPYVSISDKEYNQFKVEPGDFLFARSGTIGRYGIVPSDIPQAIFASYLIRFKFDTTKVVREFLGLFYESDYGQNQISKITQGSSNININANNIKTLKLPLPNLKEQQKIAEILSTADEQIEKTERLIEKTSELKQGLIQQFFSKGINHSEFKETEIGKIPCEWKTCFVEEIATVKTGDKDTQDKITNGKFDFYVRSQKVEKIDTYSFEGEAILTAGDGVGVGKVFHYIPEGKFDFHQRVYKISNFKKVSGKFFFYYFSKNFIKQARKFNAKTSVDSVRREMITKMIIPLPPIHEQNEIADILSSVDEQIKAYEKEREMQIGLKKALMQQLLTGKIRVTV